jgi:hypothetical protein
MSKSERKLPKAPGKRWAVMVVYDGVQVLDVAGTRQALNCQRGGRDTPI